MDQKNKGNIKANASLGTGMSLAILSTTCCALPIVLVSLGMGGAVASLMSNVPWLAAISKYKIWTFSITGLVLAYCWFLLFQLDKRVAAQGEACDINSQKILKWQKRFLWISTILLLVSIFAAYALLPIRIWLDELMGW